MSCDLCIFCEEKDKIQEIRMCHEHWYVKYDKYPVVEGHLLLIPKRHAETYFDLNQAEKDELIKVIDDAKEALDMLYEPDGYNIGINCGEDAGQTVMHCHIHLIPRYKGDCKDPRGGVRGVIPEKQKY